MSKINGMVKLHINLSIKFYGSIKNYVYNEEFLSYPKQKCTLQNCTYHMITAMFKEKRKMSKCP